PLPDPYPARPVAMEQTRAGLRIAQDHPSRLETTTGSPIGVSRRGYGQQAAGPSTVPSSTSPMPIRSSQDTHDVIIVGSGAGGGMAAYALTTAGARVLMLEAGGEWFPERDAKMLQWP